MVCRSLITYAKRHFERYNKTVARHIGFKLNFRHPNLLSARASYSNGSSSNHIFLREGWKEDNRNFPLVTSRILKLCFWTSLLAPINIIIYNINVRNSVHGASGLRRRRISRSNPSSRGPRNRFTFQSWRAYFIFDITSPLIIANVSLRLFRNPARNFGSATESVGLQSKWEWRSTPNEINFGTGFVRFWPPG